MIVFFFRSRIRFSIEKKTIIPLKMERNFEAREWLGLINDTKLYYEFTDKYPFEEKMNGLLKEVLKNHQKSVH